MRNKTKNHEVVSLGMIKTGVYDFDHDEFIVHYTNGDSCEERGGRTNYSAEIHFACDQKMTDVKGKPELWVYLPCHPVFIWQTRVVCDTMARSRKATTLTSSSHRAFWGISVFLALVALAVAILWKPHRRQQLSQATTSLVRKMFTSNSRSDDTNLLVTNVTVPTFDEPTDLMSFGRLSPEDDDELILA